MHANRVRSRQRQDEPCKARGLAGIGGRTGLGSRVGLGRRALRVRRVAHDRARTEDNDPFVAFVERGEVRRPISLRRANRREVKRYVETI